MGAPVTVDRLDRVSSNLTCAWAHFTCRWKEPSVSAGPAIEVAVAFVWLGMVTVSGSPRSSGGAGVTPDRSAAGWSLSVRSPLEVGAACHPRDRRKWLAGADAPRRFRSRWLRWPSS